MIKQEDVDMSQMLVKWWNRRQMITGRHTLQTLLQQVLQNRKALNAQTATTDEFKEI